ARTGQGTGGGGEEIQKHRASGDAAAQLRSVSRCAQDCRRRHAGKRANGAELVAEQRPVSRQSDQAGRASRLGAVAGTGGQAVARSGPLPALASLFGLFRRLGGGPGSACLRWNPPVDECKLSAGGERVGGQAAQPWRGYGGVGGGDGRVSGG